MDFRYILLIEIGKNLKDMFGDYVKYKENFFFFINKIFKILIGNVIEEKIRNILEKVKEDLDS